MIKESRIGTFGKAVYRLYARLWIAELGGKIEIDTFHPKSGAYKLTYYTDADIRACVSERKELGTTVTFNFPGFFAQPQVGRMDGSIFPGDKSGDGNAPGPMPPALGRGGQEGKELIDVLVRILSRLSADEISVEKLDQVLNGNKEEIFAALAEYKHEQTGMKVVCIEEAKENMCCLASVAFPRVFNQIFGAHHRAVSMNGLYDYGTRLSVQNWAEIDGIIVVDIAYPGRGSLYNERILVTTKDRLAEFRLKLNRENKYETGEIQVDFGEG